MTQYNDVPTRSGIPASSAYGAQPATDVNMAVINPTDRVRWGPILAGLFTALSTLAVLGVLGAAIAGTAYDPGDSGRAFGIGAGIWGAISALLAFGLGGWVAARSAAVRGHNNGLLNGAMVWAVAIPLTGYFLATGAARTVETGANVADTAMQATEDLAQTASAQIPGGNGTSQQASPGATGGGAVDAQTQERIADTTARAAWSTLIALLLGLAAAAAGGYIGARTADVTMRRTEGAAA